MSSLRTILNNAVALVARAWRIACRVPPCGDGGYVLLRALVLVACVTGSDSSARADVHPTLSFHGPAASDTDTTNPVADYIAAHDPYGNPLLLHTHASEKHQESVLAPLLGHRTLNGIAHQISERRNVHAADFFQQQLPYWEMTRTYKLLAGGKSYCFAKRGQTYAICRFAGLPDAKLQLDLREASGKYQVRWFNPRTGGELQSGSVDLVAGGNVADIGLPPADGQLDWVAQVRHLKKNDVTKAEVTKKFVYKQEPRRTLTVHLPDGWQATDKRPAVIIFRCRIPRQREHLRRLGMVVVKPLLAPVNSGQLPKLTLEEIAALPRPRNQVEDAKSVIRFVRANASRLGINPDHLVATGTSGGGDLALQSCINRSFESDEDDKSISHQPNALVLYCPAFDGIDIWFVKSEDLLKQTQRDAPSFAPYLGQFARETPEGYFVPLDHRADLVELAAVIGKREGIRADEVTAFQKVLERFNARDWQLLHPVRDALKMSASRILPKEPLPPTLIMLGDRDHLAEFQNAFVKRARLAGKQFELKVFKGGGHSFMTQPAFEEPSTREFETFLRRHGFLSKDED